MLRDEHEKRLIVLRDRANEEISKLKSSVPGEAGPSSAQAGDAIFLEDSAEEFNSQTPPISLSQEEMEQGSQDFNYFQKMIYKHIRQRSEEAKEVHITFQTPRVPPCYRQNLTRIGRPNVRRSPR